MESSLEVYLVFLLCFVDDVSMTQFFFRFSQKKHIAKEKCIKGKAQKENRICDGK